MKKKNNPFRMVGSWIGSVSSMIFYLTYWYYYKVQVGINNLANEMFEGPISSTSWNNAMSLITFKPLSLIFFVIIGFFVGWGVQSLIRRLK
jgi:hypothetical protein